MTAAAAQALLADLLDAQHHVLSRAQAAAYGVSDSAVVAAVRAGRWQRLHPGIYSTLTGPPTPAARAWAAVLAGGAGAVLSHHTAAAMYGLRTDDGPRVHISVPAGRHAPFLVGVVAHRSRRLAVSRHPALRPPRTRIEATVIDLVASAGTVDERLALVAQACQCRLTTPARLRDEVATRPTLRGRGPVLASLDDIATGAHSLLELRYLTDVERRHRLPTGHRQRAVGRGGRRQWIDVCYDDYRTVVELDGRLGHDGPGEVWRDSRRDNAAVVAGEVPLRYGWADVTGRPCAVAREVAAVLRSRGWGGQPVKCGGSCTL